MPSPSSNPPEAPNPRPASSPEPTEHRTVHPRLALVLTGGGARGAYQVGVLRGLGRAFPELRIPIITGVSAGAINASFLASKQGGLGRLSRDLARTWLDLEIEKVVQANLGWLTGNFLRWTTHLGLGGGGPEVRALLDTAPLRRLLHGELVGRRGTGDLRIRGIRDKIDTGELRAVALSTVNYGTGQTVHWVMGKDIEPWSAPNRHSRRAELTLDHVMASASLPLLFPAVRLEDGWYGDGGIRLAAPLSPALRLGADRLLAISTRYDRSPREAEESAIHGYPPPAQIAGNLMNAIFLDVVDQDVERLRRLNRVVEKLPVEQRDGLKPIRLVVIRPSEDLGRLVNDIEARLPKGLRFFIRSLGGKETKSPDFLSLLMFQREYVERLVDIGERDVARRLPELRSQLFDPAP